MSDNNEEFKIVVGADVNEEDLKKIEERIKKIGSKKIVISTDATQTKEGEKAVKGLDTTITKTTKSGKGLKGVFDNIFSRFTPQAFIAYKVIGSIRSNVKKAVEAVKEVNEALTEYRTVTGATNAEAYQLFEKANEQAKEYGATTQELIKIQTEWARQGKSQAEIEKLTQDAIILSKTAMMDEADAVQYLTATLNGYHLAAEQGTNIVDKYAKLDSSAAITAEGLAKAASRAADLARDSQITIDKYFAYLSTMNEVVQPDDTAMVGNSMKTILARMQDIKAAKLELVDDDGTTELLSDVETTLKNVGIDLRKTVTEFDSSETVLDKLAEKWNTLSSTQQAALSKAFAGVRQQNFFRALMSNYDRVKQLADISANSTGTAQEKFEAYADSVEAKSKTMQAAFESLAVNSISDKTVKSIIEATTAMIKFVDETNLLKGVVSGGFAVGLIKGFTLLRTGITAAILKLNQFSSALKIVKTGNIGQAEIQQLANLTANLSQNQLKAVLSSKALTAEQRIAILTAQGMSRSQAQAALSTMRLAAAEGTATGTTNTFSGALKGLWATIKANPVGVIFAAVSAAVMIFQSYSDSVKKMQDDSIEALNETNEHIKTVESNLKEYYKLDSSATDKEKSDALKDVIEQLNNKTTALQNATEAEEGYIKAVKDSISADYQEAANNARDARILAQDALNDNMWSTNSKGKSKEIFGGNDSTYENVLKPLLESDNNIRTRVIPLTQAVEITYNSVEGTPDEQAKAYLEYYNSLLKVQDEVRKKAQEMGKEGDELLESESYKGLLSIINDETFKGAVDNYVNAYSTEIYDSVLSKNGIPETVSDLQNLKAEMLAQAGDSALLAKAVTDKLTTAYGDLGNTATETAEKVSDTDFTIDTETFKDQIKDLTKEIKNISKAYESLSGIVEDYNSTGNFTISNLETLAELGDDYANCLFNENGQLQLNKDGFVKLAKAKVEHIRYSMLQNAISQINSLSKETETSATDDLANSTQNLTEKTLMLAAANKLAEGVSPDKIKSIIDTYSRWNAVIDSVVNGLDTNADATLNLKATKDSLKDSLNSEKDALESEKKALENNKKALEKTKEGYEKAVNALADLVSWTEKLIKQTKEDEVSALESKKKAVDDNIEKQRELMQAERDRAKQENELASKTNAVAKAKLQSDILSLDDSGAGKKAKKKADEKYIEAQKDFDDTLSDQNYEKQLSHLDELKKKNDDYYDKEIESIKSFLDNEVAVYKAACDMIDNDNGELYNKLLNYCKTYTTTTESEFNHMWQSAQSAMQDYNVANIGTFELMNNLQGRIYEVDTAIETVADGISAYETKIQGVQDKLTNLSDTAINTMNDIAAALQAEDKWQEVQAYRPKWFYNWQGTKYNSIEENRDNAIADILRQISSNYGGVYPASAGTIYGTIQHYSIGTKSAKSGVSEIDENGNIETLMKKTPSGNYVIMDKGDQVFTKEQTDNLQNISNNPSQFIDDKLIKNNLVPLTAEELKEFGAWGDISQTIPDKHTLPTINTDDITKQYNAKTNAPDNKTTFENYFSFYNTFNGDVTTQMLRMLEQKEKEIIEKSKNEFMDFMLRGRNLR